jgi:hypothetical protein
MKHFIWELLAVATLATVFFATQSTAQSPCIEACVQDYNTCYFGVPADAKRGYFAECRRIYRNCSKQCP